MSTHSTGVKLGSLVFFGAVSALLSGACFGQPASAAAAATDGSPSGSPGNGRCGGIAGLQCTPDEWCEYDNPGSCGSGDQMGTCRSRPEVCTKDCPGVTGCDGQFYCNACMAHRAGFDLQGSAMARDQIHLD